MKTRRVVALLLISGQSGSVAPICISFFGTGAQEDVSNKTVMISNTSIGIVSGDSNGQITIPPINGGWGNYTILLLDESLNCVRI